MTRLYCGGTFDCLHAGHMVFLRRAAQLGSVVVGLNTDAFAASYKRPTVMSTAERKELLRGCRYVDEVLVNLGGEDSTQTILKSEAKFIVHGDDWTGEELMKQMGLTQKFMKDNDLSFLYLPYSQGISTSDIIERCKSV